MGQFMPRPRPGRARRAAGSAVRSTSLDEPGHLADGQRRGGGEPLDGDQGDVARTALDVGPVGAVDAGPVREVSWVSPSSSRQDRTASPNRSRMSPLPRRFIIAATVACVHYKEHRL
jgi:hypothetical protein